MADDATDPRAAPADAMRFLKLFGAENGATFQLFDDANRKDARLAQVLHGTLESLHPTLAAANARAGVFWQINEGPLEGPRKADRITRVRTLAIDTDGAEVEPILADLTASGVRYHAHVETSPGKAHIYIKLADCPLGRFKHLQKALAAKYGTDASICDLSRVMRVPDYYHRKDAPFLVRLVSLNDHPSYSTDEVVQRLGLALVPAGEVPAFTEVPGFTIDAGRAYAQGREIAAAAAPAVEGDDGSRWAIAVAQSLMDCGNDVPATTRIMSEAFNPRCEPPWDEDELGALVRRAWNCRVSPVGVLAAEFEFPPLDPETCALLEAISARTDGEAKPKRSRLHWESFRDIKLDASGRELVKHLLDQGASSVLFGDSNTGKSFFALDLALHIALGWTWRGRKVAQGAVLYVAAESGHGFKKRAIAFRQHYELGDRDVPFYLVPCPVNLLDPEADTQPLIELVKAVEADCGQKVGFIVVDTLARAIAGGDENSSEAMGAFIGNADKLRTATGAHVMAVHHSGKDRSKGARGHSSLRAAIDTEIQIADGVATVTKSRDSERAAPMPFRLHVVTVGEDADGDPITSCVALDDAGAEFAENHDDHETIVRKIHAHLRRGAQTSARQLELDHGGVGGLFRVNAKRLRVAISRALTEGTLREVKRGPAKYLRLPEEMPA